MEAKSRNACPEVGSAWTSRIDAEDVQTADIMAFNDPAFPSIGGSSASRQLFEDVDKLMQKHKHDMNACIEMWLSSRHSSLGMPKAPLPLPPLNAIPLAPLLNMPEHPDLSNGNGTEVKQKCQRQITPEFTNVLPPGPQPHATRTKSADSTASADGAPHPSHKEDLVDQVNMMSAKRKQRHRRRKASQFLFDETIGRVRLEQSMLQHITESKYYEVEVQALS